MIHETVDLKPNPPQELSIGARLKQVRLEQKLDLNAIASKTQIHLKHLIAIENDDLAALPEPIYVRSLLRKYARCLDLSDELQTEIIGEYASQATVEPIKKKRNLLLPIGLPQKIQYGLYGFLVILVGGSLVYFNNTTFAPDPASQTPTSDSVANNQ